MTLASAPTLLIEPTSAWVVILAVSLVTLPVVLIARRLMRGGGGVAASILMALPLALPLLAALLYERGIFPEIAVLRPALWRELGQEPGSLEHLLFLSNGSSDALVPYLLSGSAGGLIVLIGGSISAFMLVRRLAGRIMLARITHRCVPLEGVQKGRVEKMMAVLSATARVRRVEVLVLPGWACGAFAVGGKRARILVSSDLLEALSDDELEAVLAHEIAHVTAHDMRIVALAGVLRDMTAWNPLSHIALKRLLRDRELEADRRAASMTGKPLAVASSLIKMCDLLRSRPHGRPRAALAMLRRRKGVALRVNSLLALSDGGGAVPVKGQAPFLLAGFLVLALALQVGATVASYRGSTFAIVLGTPDADDTQIWSTARQKGAAGVASGVARRSLGPLAQGIAVRRDELWSWLDAVKKEKALGRRQMQSVKDGWQALPVLEGGGMAPFGIYRVEPAFVAPQPASLEELRRSR